MKSLVIKRSVVIHGRKTSVSIEDTFWNALKELAAGGDTSLSDLVGSIASQRVDGSNLSSAIRVHVLGHFRDLTVALAGTNPNVAALQGAAASAVSARRPASALARLR